MRAALGRAPDRAEKLPIVALECPRHASGVQGVDTEAYGRVHGRGSAAAIAAVIERAHQRPIVSRGDDALALMDKGRDVARDIIRSDVEGRQEARESC